MKIPNLQNDPFVQSSLYLYPTWEYWFNQLITELQDNVGTEGFVVSSLSSENTSVRPSATGGQIGQIEAGSTPGTLVFDTYTNQMDLSYLIQGSSPAESTFRVVQAYKSTTVTEGPVTMRPGSTYLVDAASQVDFTLPSVSFVGDSIKIVRLGAGNYQIKQTAGQSIRLGPLVSTTGAGGSVTSTAIGDALTLECTIDNTEWVAFSVIGTFTIV